MTVYYQCVIFGMIGQVGNRVFGDESPFFMPEWGKTMNKQNFNDLVHGEYGRKIAYANYEEVTTANVMKILAKGITALNWNRPVIKYLQDYYKGDQPALYRTKTVRDDINNPVVENHAFEIVSFKNAQTYGEPVQCVATRNDEAINKGVDRLNEYNRNANKALVDIECGEWMSSVGFGYKAIQRKPDGSVVPYRIVNMTPMNTVVVYSEVTKEPLLAITQLKDENNEQYYQCFSEYNEYIIKNGVVRTERPHARGGIPIVEYPNNAHRLSDIEIVIPLLDAINDIQSNRVDDVAQRVQSWMKFVNCEVDEESFLSMKQNGAVVVKSNNGANKADVDIISNELNQEGTQIAKEDIWNNAMSISAIPNREGNTGGDTQGAVSLRNGWDMARQRASLKDPFVVVSDKRLNQVALKLIHMKDANECPLTEMDYDVHIVHSPTDNLLVKSEALEILLRSGIHPLVALKVSGLWADSEKVFMQSRKCLNIKQQYDIDNAIEQANVKDQVLKAEEILNG